MKRFLITIIKIYQKTLSPDHGVVRHFFRYGYCRFSPSCSQYAVDAMEQRGVIKGIWSALGRLLRCNPWNKGGIDHVDSCR